MSSDAEEELLNALCVIFGVTIQGCNTEGIAVESIERVTQGLVAC
jgi:hypothetical protein